MKGLGPGRDQPGNDPLREQPSGTVAAVGIEAEPDHWLAVPDNVGDDCHHRCGHSGKVDDGVATG